MKRVLSIDDEPMILDCIRETLSGAGYDIQTTTDPRAGLARLKSDEPFDLALLDVKMPGMSGFDVYREYRKIRKIPAIFVTAYPGSFNMSSDDVVAMWREEFADGTTDIVYKPFDLDVLLAKIEALVGGPEGPEDEA